MSVTEQHTCVDHDRGIIVREGRFRWRWTFAQRTFGQWALRDQGVAFTRPGAVSAVQRRMRSGATWLGRLDRMEIESARQHTYTLPERESAPDTEMLA